METGMPSIPELRITHPSPDSTTSYILEIPNLAGLDSDFLSMDSEREARPLMKRRAHSAEPTKAEQVKRRKLLSEGQAWLQQNHEEIVRLALTEVTDNHGETQTVNNIPKYHGPSVA